MSRLTRVAERMAHELPVVPVIVEVKRGFLDDVRAQILDLFGRVGELGLFETIPEVFDSKAVVIRRWNYVSALLPRDIVFDLADDRRVSRIYHQQLFYPTSFPVVDDPFKLDDTIFVTTLQVKRLVGADVANSRGFTGRGVTTAVLDTGASRLHPQLPHVVFKTMLTGQYRDSNGHGTHVSSIAFGKRARDPVLSRRVFGDVVVEGMAPDAGVFAVMVLGYVVGVGSSSAILRGLDYALRIGAKVVNMSLGSESKTEKPEDDPFYKPIKDLAESGVIVCVASGNSGPDENTVATPGAMPFALTVGAYDPVTGSVASFSSRGPTNWGDVKPDVVAPGVNIHSGVTGVLDWSNDRLPQKYSPLSGTSMATPVASGLVALMVEAHRRVLGRELTVDEVKRMMGQLGKPKDNESGWGDITWFKYEEWLETEYGVKL